MYYQLYMIWPNGREIVFTKDLPDIQAAHAWFARVISDCELNEERQTCSKCELYTQTLKPSTKAAKAKN